jgi:phosphoribosylformylglycinamidine synthase subunit PurQ / glutaminase
MPAKILVLRAPGTNCDEETAFAFERAGGLPERLHINELLASPQRLNEFQVLCLPGGFSFGDDIASGRILGLQLRTGLGSMLQDFKASGKLILGICNGFQVLMNCGLFWEQQATQPATLTWNESGRYLDTWVQLRTDRTPCVFLQGINSLTLPVAHGEGRFTTTSSAALAQMQAAGQLALRYADPQQADAPLDQGLAFPLNPNGAQANVAGICDATGRVFGLMPHPERYLDRTQHPRWTRGEGTEPGQGFKLFENAVAYFG